MNFTIARHINGIALNGLEYILEEEDGDVKTFETLIDARKYLEDNGFTEDEIHVFIFCDSNGEPLKEHGWLCSECGKPLCFDILGTCMIDKNENLIKDTVDNYEITASCYTCNSMFYNFADQCFYL